MSGRRRRLIELTENQNQIPSKRQCSETSTEDEWSSSQYSESSDTQYSETDGEEDGSSGRNTPVENINENMV